MENASSQILTEGINTLIQPYLGKQEYGRMYIIGPEPVTMPNRVSPTSVEWMLGYEMVFGSSSLIHVEYDESTGEFNYMDIKGIEVITSNPEQALEHVRGRLENIRPERKGNLRRNAQMKKNNGVSLEQAIGDVKSVAERYPEYGPTDEELVFYESVAQEIFNS